MASRRELLRAYDLFLCDHHVADYMPRILGRTFIAAGKYVLIFDAEQQNARRALVGFRLPSSCARQSLLHPLKRGCAKRLCAFALGIRCKSFGGSPNFFCWCLDQNAVW